MLIQCLSRQGRHDEADSLRQHRTDDAPQPDDDVFYDALDHPDDDEYHDAPDELGEAPPSCDASEAEVRSGLLALADLVSRGRALSGDRIDGGGVPHGP